VCAARKTTPSRGRRPSRMPRSPHPHFAFLSGPDPQPDAVVHHSAVETLEAESFGLDGRVSWLSGEQSGRDLWAAGERVGLQVVDGKRLRRTRFRTSPSGKLRSPHRPAHSATSLRVGEGDGKRKVSTAQPRRALAVAPPPAQPSASPVGEESCGS
jgi:hypothetical protein